MIPILVACWAVSAPMGYLVGDLFVSRVKFQDEDFARAVPWLAGIFPPLGAILALVVMVQIETATKDDNQ